MFLIKDIDWFVEKYGMDYILQMLEDDSKMSKNPDVIVLTKEETENPFLAFKHLR